MTQSQTLAAAPYRVLARKWRPHSFADLIGQEALVRTLTNAFRKGRIAQAYMLTGVRGVGKTTTARILARALNYKLGEINAPTIDFTEPGEHCQAIMEGRHVDVIEMDAASNTGIDDIREIIDSVQYAPAIARYKVYIIDEVHMLSKNAFNGLLKTLEEPPPHLKFVFATTEIRKVPVTVLSRCQRFDLRRIESATLAAHLEKICAAEGIGAEADSLALIARAADGSVRDALSLLDQAIAHSAEAITAEEVRSLLGMADRARVIDLFEMAMKGDTANALAELKSQYDLGADPAVVVTDLAEFTHLVTRLKLAPDLPGETLVAKSERDRAGGFAAKLSVRELDRAWQILVKGLAEITASERPLAAADMVVVRLTHAATLPPPEELLRKLATGDGGAAARSAPQTRPPAGQPVRGEAGTKTIPGAQSGAMISARPQIAPKSAPRAAPQTATQPETMRTPVVLNRFEDLILLAEDKRDIQLRTNLRRFVRLIAFADGRMEFTPAGELPAGFLSDLSAKLQQWTNRRWMIATSREGGAPTLEEAERQREGMRNAQAASDPDVIAIRAQFPGARVIDVRFRPQIDALGLEASDGEAAGAAPDEIADGE